MSPVDGPAAAGTAGAGGVSAGPDGAMKPGGAARVGGWLVAVAALMLAAATVWAALVGFVLGVVLVVAGALTVAAGVASLAARDRAGPAGSGSASSGPARSGPVRSSEADSAAAASLTMRAGAKEFPRVDALEIELEWALRSDEQYRARVAPLLRSLGGTGEPDGDLGLGRDRLAALQAAIDRVETVARDTPIVPAEPGTRTEPVTWVVGR